MSETQQKELGSDYPAEEDNQTALTLWYEENKEDIKEFEKQMKKKVH